jgi:hypothetical protein
MATKTTKTTTDQPARYLLLREERTQGYDRGYYHLYGRVVTQKYEQGSPQPEGPDDRYSDGPLYSGLQLRCQGDAQSRERAIAGDRESGVYGYECEYHDLHSVDRRAAVRMAKTLTTLEAKLSKLQEQRGYVRTYGEYCGRVAEALGCVGIAHVRTERERATCGERWIWRTLGDGIRWIDGQIGAWVDEARPATPEPEPEPAAVGADAAQEVN